MFDWLTNLFGGTEEAWRAAAERFVNASRELDAAEEQHLRNRPIAVELGDLEAWDSLQDKTLYTRQAVNDLADALRDSSQWFRSTFGMSSLNALPLVPIAVITASISAVVSLVYALRSYNENINRKWTFINSRPDLTPDQAIEILESDASGLSISNTVTWLVIGGAALVLVPHLLNAGKK